MKIFTTLLTWHFSMGMALLGYVWAEWQLNKKKIIANGWNLNMCTPFKPWWATLLFFVPVVRYFWYYCTGDFISQVARLKKADHPELHVRLLGYDVVYTEID